MNESNERVITELRQIWNNHLEDHRARAVDITEELRSVARTLDQIRHCLPASNPDMARHLGDSLRELREIGRCLSDREGNEAAAMRDVEQVLTTVERTLNALHDLSPVTTPLAAAHLEDILDELRQIGDRLRAQESTDENEGSR